MMQNSDEVVDRLLARLGEAQPSAGMEQRVLAVAQARVGVRSGTRLRARWGWMLAGAAACAASAACVLWLPRAHAPVVPTRAVARVVEPVAPAWIARPVRRVSTISGGKAARRPERETASEPISLAMAETLAPSLPAPPLPLTREEELLAHVGRHPDPVQQAELNPEKRAAELAESREEVRQFFAVNRQTESNGGNP